MRQPRPSSPPHTSHLAVLSLSLIVGIDVEFLLSLLSHRRSRTARKRDACIDRFVSRPSPRSAKMRAMRGSGRIAETEEHVLSDDLGDCLFDINQLRSERFRAHPRCPRYKSTPPPLQPPPPNAPSISSNVGNPPSPVSPKLSGLHRSKLIGTDVDVGARTGEVAARSGSDVSGATAGIELPKRALDAKGSEVGSAGEGERSGSAGAENGTAVSSRGFCFKSLPELDVCECLPERSSCVKRGEKSTLASSGPKRGASSTRRFSESGWK